MTVAEYKLAWFLARRAELNERGLKDAQIAQKMGYKPAYISQVVTKKSPAGDALIDKMCSTFSFRFLPTSELSNNETTANHESELVKIIERLMADLREATQALKQNHDQIGTLSRMISLMADALQAQGVDLRGVREELASLVARLNTSLEQATPAGRS